MNYSNNDRSITIIRLYLQYLHYSHLLGQHLLYILLIFKFRPRKILLFVARRKIVFDSLIMVID